MVKRVVIDVIKTLDIVPLEVAKHPVGLESVKNVLIRKLNLDSMDRVVKAGIWGIGGIGKTTAAKAVYSQIYLDFDASFVPNVRATAKEPADLTKLQEVILSDFHGNVESVDWGISLLKNFLRGKRVLLVLDDVYSREQLNALVGDWLVLGSRVIITSRDRHILNIGGVSSKCMHEMSGLKINEGLELFSWHAFLTKSPSASHKDLSKSIVEACKGHPLSLEVIGFFLYDKHEDQGCWEEALHDITQNSKNYNRLYISYNVLTNEEKEIFLDIACFFIGEEKTLPIVFWKSMYKKVHTAISNLSMKLLIKFDDEECFDMHDHLQDMGWTIAEKDKKGARKWEHAHLNNLSHLRIIGGNLQSLEMLYTEGLRYLHLEYLTIECTTKNPLSMLPRSLIWLRLESCSFEVGMNRAVNKPRIPRHSGIVDNTWQCKIIQINGCYSLELLIPPPISPPKLPDSIDNLSQLRHLDLGRCNRLSNLPDSIGNLSHLQHLNLKNCYELCSLPDNIGNLSQLQYLNLEFCTNLRSLPDTIGDLSSLQNLNLQRCFDLSSLPDSIGNLTQLQDFDLTLCSSLSILPDTFGNLSQLKKLNMTCHNLSSFTNNINNLSQLQLLNMGPFNRLSNLSDNIGSLSNLSQLRDLRMSYCENLSILPNNIGNYAHLQHLDLFRCTNLSYLPNSIGNLSQLQDLNLGVCRSLSSLLGVCRSLSSLPDSIGNLSQLHLLSLEGCESLGNLPNSIGDLSQL